MKKPLLQRNTARARKKINKNKKNNKESSKRWLIWRKLRPTVLLLAAFSVAQYGSTGSITWPADLMTYVAESLQEYATRPGSGWRLATKKLEEIGAAREGTAPSTFDLTGRIVRIADGDTVSLLDQRNKQHKVRLFGIDTPERDQPFGRAARNALKNFVGTGEIGVVVVETDAYGRLVGTLYRGDTNINTAMVAGGYAWWYQYYAPHERHLAEAERKARQQRLGLWAASKQIPPWDWRKRQRQGL